jgi:hypothetical protein
MGEKVMACNGTTETDGWINVRGSYAMPPGPDWGWRIVIRRGDGRSLQEEQLHPEGSKGGNWVYTGLESGAENGNPGSFTNGSTNAEVKRFFEQL